MKDLNEALERNNMAFDPDQPRDSKGEWVAAGGGGNVDERAQRAAEVMRSMYYSAKLLISRVWVELLIRTRAGWH